MKTKKYASFERYIFKDGERMLDIKVNFYEMPQENRNQIENALNNILDLVEQESAEQGG